MTATPIRHAGMSSPIIPSPHYSTFPISFFQHSPLTQPLNTTYTDEHHITRRESQNTKTEKDEHPPLHIFHLARAPSPHLTHLHLPHDRANHSRGVRPRRGLPRIQVPVMDVGGRILARPARVLPSRGEAVPGDAGCAVPSTVEREFCGRCGTAG